MLLKSADDKSPRVQMLEGLNRQSTLSLAQRKWVRDELMRLRKGIQGERESAHYLDSYFKDGVNHVLLHDLRFVVDGETAQVDHMVINRMGMVYLIETKNYAGNLLINDYGEFTVEYDEDRFGIPSPIEQSQRHERLLVKLMERLELSSRLGELQFHHVVLLHPKASIQRPAAKAFDTSMVIKADQFPTWHQTFAEKKIGFGTLLKGMVNIRSLETIKEWGEKLVRQHRPADLTSLPDFIRSAGTSSKPEKPDAASKAPVATVPVTNTPSAAASKEPGEAHPLAKKLICVTCGTKISYSEGKFCWNNSRRFSGLQYCREHQAAF